MGGKAEADDKPERYKRPPIRGRRATTTSSDPGSSRREGLIAAVKADALSPAAWQVGMYGWMAIARFAIVGRPFDRTSALFRVRCGSRCWRLRGELPGDASMLRFAFKGRM
ncbi:MAG TPA: hypothetical protein VHT91_21905 [Kofleriaceae bacterium]|nr:hypothetical protein [Kofleriaceae bacterium]